jgi:uncharacterized protein YigA (DUF484 family)
MTKQSVRGVDTESTSEEAVADYLQNHPDFFERNAGVLARLRVPHERGVLTVSLVERQVLVLRDKNQKLEGKVREFVDVARANDALSDKIHRLARRLIRARGASQLVDTLEASLREDFGASQWLLVLNRTDVPDLNKLTSRHIRVVERTNAELKMFETFFESARPRCGQIRDSQRDYLFGEGTVAIGSAALVPLGPNSSYGLLAIGSPDVDRFHPTMSTEFLARIGELVSEAVGAL